jgi:hypothetical protein
MVLVYARAMSIVEIPKKGTVCKSEQTIHIGSRDSSLEVNGVTACAGVWKRKREELKKRRAPRFKRYEKNPSDLGLALEIRMIDDQIAECTEQMARENALSGASTRSFAATSGQRTRPASLFA